MNKLKFFLIAFFVFSTFSNQILAQNKRSSSDDEDRIVYWFYIRPEIKPLKEYNQPSGRPVYTVRKMGNNIKNGQLEDYEKDLWTYLNKGSKLPVGPYDDPKFAKHAQEMYGVLKKPDSIAVLKQEAFAEFVEQEDVFWFFLKFEMNSRTKAYRFKRTPARVAQGSVDLFYSLMIEGLMFKNLAIGPFSSQIEAEDAKRIYRKEEN